MCMRKHMSVLIVIMLYNKLELEYLDQKPDIDYRSSQPHRSTNQQLETNSLTKEIQFRDIKQLLSKIWSLEALLQKMTIEKAESESEGKKYRILSLQNNCRTFQSWDPEKQLTFRDCRFQKIEERILERNWSCLSIQKKAMSVCE